MLTENAKLSTMLVSHIGGCFRSINMLLSCTFVNLRLSIPGRKYLVERRLHRQVLLRKGSDQGGEVQLPLRGKMQRRILRLLLNETMENGNRIEHEAHGFWNGIK